MKQTLFPIEKIVMLFLAFGLMLNIMAQKKINLAELNSDQLNLYREKAVKMNNTGMTLTLLGGATAITGGILLVSYAGATILDSDYDTTKENIYGTIMLSGLVSTGVGIPLWIIGGNRWSKAEIALKKYNIKIDNSTAVGLGLTVSF